MQNHNNKLQNPRRLHLNKALTFLGDSVANLWSFVEKSAFMSTNINIKNYILTFNHTEIEISLSAWSLFPLESSFASICFSKALKSIHAVFFSVSLDMS